MPVVVAANYRLMTFAIDKAFVVVGRVVLMNVEPDDEELILDIHIAIVVVTFALVLPVLDVGLIIPIDVPQVIVEIIDIELSLKKLVMKVPNATGAVDILDFPILIQVVVQMREAATLMYITVHRLLWV